MRPATGRRTFRLGATAAKALAGAAILASLAGPATGAPAPEAAAPPLQVAPQNRAQALKEVERGAKKERRGKDRAALRHYLTALALDPYNATARDGLARLIGPIGGATRPAPPEAPDESPSAEPAPRNPPGAPSLRTTGPDFQRAEPFLGHVRRSAERYAVDPRLILGVIRVESNFNPRARSVSGARGLMQLLPETARRFGARSIDDPAQNIDAGTHYLRYLLDLFRGDVDRALAGYNAGEMSVVRAGGVPPAAGVRRFVRDVKASARQF